MSKLMDRLRALIAEDDADEVEADEIEADEIEADEVEGDADEVEGDADEIEGDADEVEGDADEVEGDDPGTMDDHEESPEVAELRQTIGTQAALIETLRNQVAALGGDPIEDGVEVDSIDETAEDAVADFDSDYAEREARLAEMKGN